ncbi:MAG: hypothetical protein V9G24_07130 [Rhodoblastus sp.]
MTAQAGAAQQRRIMFALGEHRRGNDGQRDERGDERAVARRARTFQRGGGDAAPNIGSAERLRDNQRFRADAAPRRRDHRRQIDQDRRRRIGIGDVDIGARALQRPLGEGHEPGDVEIDAAPRLDGGGDRDDGAGARNHGPARPADGARLGRSDVREGSQTHAARA